MIPLFVYASLDGVKTIPFAYVVVALSPFGLTAVLRYLTFPRGVLAEVASLVLRQTIQELHCVLPDSLCLFRIAEAADNLHPVAVP